MPARSTSIQVELKRKALGSKEIVVTARFPMDLDVGDDVAAIARSDFAAEIECNEGRLVGDRTRTVRALFPKNRRGNAFMFADHAFRFLAQAEDHQSHVAEDALAVYRFERVFGPTVFLALHPAKRGAEAFAVLAGEGVIEEDDTVDEDELAEVTSGWLTSNLPRRAVEQLSARFESAKIPSVLGAFE